MLRLARIRKLPLLAGLCLSLLSAVPGRAELTYTVKHGDLLPQIAAYFSVTLDDLCNLNKIYNPDVLYVNQVLRLPEHARVPAAAVTPEIPVKPVAPVLTATPVIPVAPATPGASRTPIVSTAPQAPAGADIPVAPALPALSPALAASSTPAASAAPVVPAPPVPAKAPTVSLTPDASTEPIPLLVAATPLVPKAPITPFIPGAPGVPAVSMGPKAPASPDIPTAQAPPAASVTPKGPGNASAPTVQKAPVPAKVQATPVAAKDPEIPVSSRPETAVKETGAGKGTAATPTLTGRELLLKRQQLLAERAQSQPAAAPDNSRAGIVAAARAYLGTRYSRGGLSSRGIDCSGLVVRAMAAMNKRVPHQSAQLYRMGVKVKYADLQPGDLVFFNTTGRGVSHVGIWIGDNKFIHASSSRGVTIDRLAGYYSRRLVGAKRLQ
ncbi:MAG: C40 family peptidase [Armatimonadota bacterium]